MIGFMVAARHGTSRPLCRFAPEPDPPGRCPPVAMTGRTRSLSGWGGPMDDRLEGQSPPLTADRTGAPDPDRIRRPGRRIEVLSERRPVFASYIGPVDWIG